ncbi:G-protein-signaling modulator 1 isoform 5-T5 [Lycaon pictus]
MEAGVGAPGRLCNCWKQRGALSLGGPSGDPGPGARPKRTQRLSAETWGLLRLPLERSIPRAPSSDEECFFDLLSKFQSSRMDDQRCPLEEGQPGAAEATAAPTPEERVAQPSLTASPQTEELLDLIASSQSRRLDDQRASVGSLPGLRVTHSNLGRLRGDGDPQEPGDEFFNMLIKCQSSRIDDQRCPPPDVLPRGPTMPDEDFFSLIQRVQAKRMDEQRVDLAGSPEQEADGSPEPRQQCQPGAS